MGVELDNSVAKTVVDEANTMMAAVAKLATAIEKEGFSHLYK